MAGRFPLFTDNHVRQAIVEGLLREGWRVVRSVDALGEGVHDPVVFEYAANEGLVFVTSDERIHAIAMDWLAAEHSVQYPEHLGLGHDHARTRTGTAGTVMVTARARNHLSGGVRPFLG